jgi:periplasmic protein TonB
MDRHYGLPVAFAAAAHAALLFGFDKCPRPVAAKEPERVVREWRLSPPPEPEVVVASDPSEARPASREPLVAPLPRSVEPPPTVVPDGFVITPPPVGPVSTSDIRRMLDDTIGVPGGTGTKWIGDIADRVSLDNPPRTRFQVSPVYPYEGKTSGMPSGEVVVEFVVDEEGRVHDPRVTSSSHRMFEEPTLRAVAKWVFEPGRRAGKIVRFKMAVPVVFKLND